MQAEGTAIAKALTLEHACVAAARRPVWLEWSERAGARAEGQF